MASSDSEDEVSIDPSFRSRSSTYRIDTAEQACLAEALDGIEKKILSPSEQSATGAVGATRIDDQTTPGIGWPGSLSEVVGAADKHEDAGGADAENHGNHDADHDLEDVSCEQTSQVQSPQGRGKARGKKSPSPSPKSPSSPKSSSSSPWASKKSAAAKSAPPRKSSFSKGRPTTPRKSLAAKLQTAEDSPAISDLQAESALDSTAISDSLAESQNIAHSHDAASMPQIAGDDSSSETDAAPPDNASDLSSATVAQMNEITAPAGLDTDALEEIAEDSSSEPDESRNQDDHDDVGFVDALGNSACGENEPKPCKEDDELLEEPSPRGKRNAISVDPALVGESSSDARRTRADFPGSPSGLREGRDSVLVTPALAHRHTIIKFSTGSSNHRSLISIGGPRKVSSESQELSQCAVDSPSASITHSRDSSHQRQRHRNQSPVHETVVEEPVPAKTDEEHDGASSGTSRASKQTDRSARSTRSASKKTARSARSAKSERSENNKHHLSGRSSGSNSSKSDVPSLLSSESDSDTSSTSDSSLEFIGQPSERARSSVQSHLNAVTACSQRRRGMGSNVAGGRFRSIEGTAEIMAKTLAERRPALVPGLELIPYYETDPNFTNFATIVRTEARSVERPELMRAVVHYRREVQSHPTNYVAHVNCACCYALLNQHAKALPLLSQAIRLCPEKASGHVNQVLSLIQNREHAAAYDAIERALAAGGSIELSKAHRSLLLRCKATLLFRSQEATASTPRVDRSCCSLTAASFEYRWWCTTRGWMVDDKSFTHLCCEAAAAAAVEDPIDAPAEVRTAIIQRRQVSRQASSEQDWNMEEQPLEELRQGLSALRGPPGQVDPQPPWGRRHAFSSDDTKAGIAGPSQQEWRPLHPDNMEDLRQILSHCAPGDESMDRGKAAYEAAKELTFMRGLEAHQASALLNLAELLQVERDTYIFMQGDRADYMYVIASGSVRIEATMEIYGPHPVTLDTFFDGQSFGENQNTAAESSRRNQPRATLVHGKSDAPVRRASVITQEPCALLRFLPLDYRRVIGAAVDDSSMPSHVKKRQTRPAPSPADSALSGGPGNLPNKQGVFEPGLRGLKKVPFFEACSEYYLTLLATKADDLNLRFGDEVVRFGEVPRGCFIIVEGFCSISVPAPTEKREISRRFAEEQRDGEVSSRERSATDERSSVKDSFGNAEELDAYARAMPRRSRGVSFQEPPCGSGVAAVRGKSHSLIQAPSIASPATRAPRPTVRTGPRAPNRVPARRTPRAGTPWAATLRTGKPSWSTGAPPAKDIDLGFLSPGQAFGLGALYDAKGECPYPAGVTVRVDSDMARILMFTQRSLLYLPDALGSTVMQRCRETTDPAQPSPEVTLEEIKNHREWDSMKRQLLQHEMTSIP